MHLDLHFILIEQLYLMKGLWKQKKGRNESIGRREIDDEWERKMQDCEICIRQRDIRAAFKIVMRNIGSGLLAKSAKKEGNENEIKNESIFIYIVNVSRLHAASILCPHCRRSYRKKKIFKFVKVWLHHYPSILNQRIKFLFVRKLAGSMIDAVVI